MTSLTSANLTLLGLLVALAASPVMAQWSQVARSVEATRLPLRSVCCVPVSSNGSHRNVTAATEGAPSHDPAILQDFGARRLL